MKKGVGGMERTAGGVESVFVCVGGRGSDGGEDGWREGEREKKSTRVTTLETLPCCPGHPRSL